MDRKVHLDVGDVVKVIEHHTHTSGETHIGAVGEIFTDADHVLEQQDGWVWVQFPGGHTQDIWKDELQLLARAPLEVVSDADVQAAIKSITGGVLTEMPKVTTVYILERCYPYEPSEIEGVFLNAETPKSRCPGAWRQVEGGWTTYPASPSTGVSEFYTITAHEILT